MVYISPILGYQDGVILSLLLVALKFEKSKNFILSGLFLAAAVLTKQLVLIVLPGIFLYQILNKKEKVFIPVLKMWTSFFLSVCLFLSPFFITDHGPRILKSLVESSNHAVLSANGANLGWLITWVSRMRSNGLFAGVKLGGSGNLTWELTVLNHTVSIRLLLLLMMLSIMGLIASIAMWCRYRNRPVDVYVIGSAVYLAYCFFGTGVHENHVYLGLGLVTCAELSRSNKITKLTLLGWFILCLHLFSTYGVGRSIAFRIVPDTLTQVFIFLALLTYLSLLIRSLLWLIIPPSRPVSTSAE
jgi:heme/copper-type cytochrome/quinol oxidase subunit 3